MPLYEYYCDKCKLRFEAIINKNYRDKVVCTKCQMLAKRTVSKCEHVIKGYCYKNEYPKAGKE